MPWFDVLWRKRKIFVGLPIGPENRGILNRRPSKQQYSNAAPHFTNMKTQEPSSTAKACNFRAVPDDFRLCGHVKQIARIEIDKQQLGAGLKQQVADRVEEVVQVETFHGAI